MKENKEFMTAQGVADLLKVNVMTIYRYIESGKLEAHKIGKEFRIEKVAFNKFLDNTKTKK